MEKSIIKIVNMSFKYKKEDYLFRNFNLEIKEGSFTTIIGKNGSGKSTLAKILIGLYKAEGYIAIDGYLLNDFYMKKIRREFSVCFDNADNHFIGETVKDDLAFTLENLEYSKKEMTSSINMIAKKFKLEDILELSPDKLTNSEKEKVMIASALIHKPKILLLDESIYKLNASDKKLIFKVLKEYQKEYKLTIILITHDLEDTLLSDNILVLDKGKIVMYDTKEKIYQDEKLEKLGFNLPFIVKLSHNLMLYDLLDKVYSSFSWANCSPHFCSPNVKRVYKINYAFKLRRRQSALLAQDTIDKQPVHGIINLWHSQRQKCRVRFQDGCLLPFPGREIFLFPSCERRGCLWLHIQSCFSSAWW